MCAASQSPIGDMGNDDPDNPLRARLRERIESKSESENTESEGNYGDDDDSEDDDPEEMEMNMGEDAKQGVQMIAESLGVEPGEVEDTLMPLMEDGDDTDDPAEMAAEDAVSEETVEEKIDEATDGMVTEEELEAKLEDTVDALGGEVRNIVQESNVGSTPSPDSTGGGSADVQLFSDGGSDGGDK